MTDILDEIPDGYAPSLKDAEWFIILSRGAFGFRYGPYAAEKAGEILKQCTDEGITCYLTANCGTEFDWDIARDFARGNPGDWRLMGSAPKDGTEVMGDCSDVETRMVWWEKLECWRELLPDGSSVGKPVHHQRWRPLTAAERRPATPHPDHNPSDEWCTCPDCVGF